MIHLSSYLMPKLIKLNLKFSSKEEILSFISDLLYQNGFVKDRKQTYQELVKREKIQSTGIGKGVAIPHLLSPLEKPVIGFITLKEAVDFEALDERPVDLIFFSAASNSNIHLRMLARLSRMIKETNLVDRLRKAKSEEEAIKAFHQEELRL